jgi:glycosyltransferase involved in cell wall biosynthesis
MMVKSALTTRVPRHIRVEASNQLLQQGERWISSGNDPYFSLLDERDGAPVSYKAGWYLLTVKLSDFGPATLEPRLYVDYGQGFSEVDSIALSSKLGPGGVEMVVCFHQAAHALRFDPATKPCHFYLSGMSLKPLSKYGAAAYMLGQLFKSRGRKRTAEGILRELGWRGPSSAVQWLVNTYQREGDIRPDDDYTAWVRQYDTLSDADREAIKHKISLGENWPVISIVMPVYDTAERWLRQCIDSVRNQLYPHWELCIADDASPSPSVRRVLEHYVKLDQRIKVEMRGENGHISRSSNTALALATGEFVALLDHDDELPEHALYLVAEAITQHPDAQIIYTDEDKITEEGVRFDPYFKSEWNPDLFRGHNMISHFGAYRTSLLREIGGFRVGFEGSQDYDLALRCIEHLRREQIVHIPHVLYHWRAIAGSTALGPSEKNYAHHAAKKALTAHIERIGLHGKFEELERFHGNWSFKPELTENPLISIIIPTRDGLDFLTRCLKSIRELSTYKNFEILIVDNQSSKPEMLRYLSEQAEFANTRVLSYDHPFNYSALNNYAATFACGEVLLLLNDDTKVITPSWMEEMAGHVMRPEVGAVGAMLYYPTNLVQHAGVVLGMGAAGVAGHAYHLKPRGYPGQMCRMHLTQEYSAVTAACMMIRKAVFDQVGGFDESLQVAFNDIDLCLRIRKKGLRIVWTPRAELYHYESVTRGSDEDPIKKVRFDDECVRFKERWGEQLGADPFFNPNLRLDQATFHVGGTRSNYSWRCGDFEPATSVQM